MDTKLLMLYLFAISCAQTADQKTQLIFDREMAVEDAGEEVKDGAEVMVSVRWAKSSNLLGSEHLSHVGDQVTNLTSHPYQVAITDHEGDRFVCAGALLSSVWVVTLASCVKGANHHALLVRTESNNPLEGGTLLNVTHVVAHPLYNYSTLDYDVALLRMGVDLAFVSHSRRVAVSTQAPLTKSKGVLSGWKSQKMVNFTEYIFRELEMAVLPTQKCKRQYDVSNDVITARMYCATVGDTGPCYSDFGDPLVINGTLYGLYSWSRGCGNPKYPAVFTSLAKVRSWLTSVMKDPQYCICQEL